VEAVSPGRLLLVALALVASGCYATGPLFAGYDPISEGEGRLPTGSAGQGSPVDVSLNGRALASLRNDGFVSVPLQPGDYELTAYMGGLTPQVGQRFRIAPGRATFCGYKSSTNVILIMFEIACSDDAEAHAALGQCKREPIEPGWVGAAGEATLPPAPEQPKCPKPPSWRSARRTTPEDEECR
jgi:hypothetical protein